MNLIHKLLILETAALIVACGSNPQQQKTIDKSILMEKEEILSVDLKQDTSPSFALAVNKTGRYQITVFGKAEASNAIWVEDYIDNKDDRTYNVTGKMRIEGKSVSRDGSPLAVGNHLMMIHADSINLIDSIQFKLMFEQESTPNSMTQNMKGEEWSLVWSDEFDGTGLPDSSKWAYNIGNWGWGNNEPQYYTDSRTENARQENGNLIIEAKKNDIGNAWTSARLTTQGRTSFLYGRVEYRAKVPAGRGTWAAGWLLGDEYRDELSWPYCGEIDVLECVGYEINDTTGSGLNHATCHTRAYYFKQGNQIGSEIELDSMNTKFHTYAVEWYPNEIKGFIDGEHYYTYDKTANELEWPFNKAQNIIINLAVGGGWGGAKGIEESYDSHQYILDYVRVYEKK